MKPAGSRGDPAGPPRTGSGGNGTELISFKVAGQALCIPIDRVQEVQPPRKVSPVPLAPPQVAGFLNLRGQIVTVVDLAVRLSFTETAGASGKMHLVVVGDEELFSFLVDEVCEVFHADADGTAPPPVHLPESLAAVCRGVCEHDGRLLLWIDADAVISSKGPAHKEMSHAP